MPIKRPPLVNDEIYHIVLRGVGDSLVFKDINDYYRGIFSLYEFNDSNPVLIRDRRRDRLRAKKSGREQFSAIRDVLVDIFAFCFMPNHIHLLLKQIKDNGITKFMRKIGAGYASFFNKKYERQGHLFQGRFKAILVKSDEQLINTFVYIHTNPISLVEPGWKEGVVKNPRKAITFLESYKWFSYLDYIGKNNFSSLTNRNFLSETIGGSRSCKKLIDNWIERKKQLNNFNKIILE